LLIEIADRRSHFETATLQSIDIQQSISNLQFEKVH